ncbi:ABC transporter ATP-binding protein [Amnibacterium kyonggiense]|uniref:Peptide/nickel transport system ATP-binding protein n=1 Tax=Amnibacterium kyonggiense TaxID=595671 RepID=A0A4R7FR22_9MICO|nr:ABC transporter ATP-binding protein [Amnibacterium kyonggiense]TDS80241.1 peptide/nickel transport system ATP-binding protein [Amnibacterium kyonggiense]
MTLEVRGLTIRIGDRTVVDDVSFTVPDGGRFGLIGGSGSGKSLTVLAILGLLPDGADATGSVLLDGVELLGAPERRLARVRGSRIGTVFQDPQTALNPLRTIGRQLAEPLRLRGRLTRTATRAEAVRLAGLVRLPDPGRVVDAYPHQLSGGQRQRVAIGIALALSPGLLLADEPTTALDVTTQAEVLGLFDRLVADAGASLVFVTHDLAVLAGITREVLVLSEGRAVERGPVAQVLAAPQHPVTAALVAAARATSFGAGEGS